MLTLRRDLDKKVDYDENNYNRYYSNKTCENKNYVKDYDYCNDNKRNFNNYNDNNNYRQNDELAVDDSNYEIVNNASEDYRNYLWNELRRDVPKKIYSEEEFNNTFGGRYNYNQNVEEQQESNEINENEMANYQIENSNVRKQKRVINKGGKIAICAYFLFVSIIVLLIALSSNIDNNVMAITNDAETENNTIINNDAINNIDNTAFYNEKIKINYDNVNNDNLLPLNSVRTKEKSSNWFDSICDLIENLVGG